MPRRIVIWPDGSVASTTSQGAFPMRLSSIAASLISLAKLRFALVALAAILSTAPSHAEFLAFVGAAGTSTDCEPTNPCSSIAIALGFVQQPIRIICLGGTLKDQGSLITTSGTAVDIDCPQGTSGGLQIKPSATNVTVRVWHLTFRNGDFSNALLIQGSGTVILEDCVFGDSTGVSLDVEPNGPLNLVIKNSRISNAGSGILLKPAAGGSIKATLDHVTITTNNGGGIKSDSTNGVVNLDISDSEISNNGGNGINLVGSANQNMLNLSRTVIAKNGVAGLQVNGATTAALIDTTLFDTNTSGATSVVGGGHVLTYANNRIVGSSGSGFTGPVPLQ
jgi:Right handed beta helix region